MGLPVHGPLCTGQALDIFSPRGPGDTPGTYTLKNTCYLEEETQRGPGVKAGMQRGKLWAVGRYLDSLCQAGCPRRAWSLALPYSSQCWGSPAYNTTWRLL